MKKGPRNPPKRVKVASRPKPEVAYPRTFITLSTAWHISNFHMVISNLNLSVIRTPSQTYGPEVVLIDGRVDVAVSAEEVEGDIHLLLAHLAIKLLCNLKQG